MSSSKARTQHFLQDVRDSLDEPLVRWSIVLVVVLVLLKFKLVVFAAVLPAFVYWHQSQQVSSEAKDEQEGADQVEDDDEDAQYYGSHDKETSSGRPLHQGVDDVFDEDDMESWSFKMDNDSQKKKTAFNANGDANAFDSNFTFPSKLGRFQDDLGMDGMFGGPPTLGGRGDDFGFLGGLGEPSKGKGKGKGKEKGSKGNDPKQIFISGFGDMSEDNIKSHFATIGEIDRCKFLTHADTGLPKGNCFITFRTEEQAQESLRFDQTYLDGKRLYVRLAGSPNTGGGGPPDKGGKGKRPSLGFEGGKGRDEPRQPDPKQVFVAGVGDTDEDAIRAFFGEAGRIERFKLLTTVDGQSKGACFVTFSSVDEARRALLLSGADLEGKRIRVSPSGAPTGGGGKKGDGGKGDDRKGGKGEERFSNDERRGRTPTAPQQRTEIDDLLDEALDEENGVLRPSDFDGASKRLLTKMMERDRVRGTQNAVNALEMVFAQTRKKQRDDVHKWTSYVFKLLQAFQPDRGTEGSAEDGGKHDTKPSQDSRLGDIDFAWDNLPKEADGVRQVLDRWGKPVLIY